MKRFTVILIVLLQISSLTLLSDWNFKEKLIGNKMEGAVSFDNMQFGFLTTNLAFYSLPKFYLTIDGGKTWEQTLKHKDIFLDTIEYNHPFEPLCITKAKDDVVYMMNEKKIVLKSIDKGKNWNRFISQFDDSNYVGYSNFFNLKMYDSKFGFLATDFQIYQTIDSCKSFKKFNLPFSQMIGIYDIEIINVSTYLLFIYDSMSNKNRYMKTTDYGVIWSEITDFTYNRNANYIDKRNYLWKALPASNTSGSYNDNILCSKDTGQTWEIKFSYHLGTQPINNIEYINFSSLELGIAHGYKGKIFITDNAGETWSDLSIPEQLNKYNDINAAFRVSKEKTIAIDFVSNIYVYDSNVGITISKIDEELNVFPNPCTDKLIIDYGFNKPNEIILYDLLGNIVSSTNDNYINTTDLSKGTYLLYLKYDNKFKKFIIQKN